MAQVLLTPKVLDGLPMVSIRGEPYILRSALEALIVEAQAESRQAKVEPAASADTKAAEAKAGAGGKG